MKATQILMEEHRIILRVITALESATRRLSAGEEMPTEFFLKAADFIKEFADGCHHRKEEGVLFVSLVESGMSKESGPVAVMLAEHEQGRVYTRGMREGAERWQGGDPEGRAQVVKNAEAYAVLLRQHIRKEDHILFPMSERVIPVEQHAQVNAAFERIEQEEKGAGLHEKTLRLAEELEILVK